MRRPTFLGALPILSLALAGAAAAATPPAWGTAPSVASVSAPSLANPLVCTVSAKHDAQTGQATGTVNLAITNNGAPLPAGTEIQVTGAGGVSVSQSNSGSAAIPVVKTAAVFPSAGYEQIDVPGAGTTNGSCTASITSGYTKQLTSGADTSNSGAGALSLTDLANAVNALTARVSALESEVAALQKK